MIYVCLLYINILTGHLTIPILVILANPGSPPWRCMIAVQVFQGPAVVHKGFEELCWGSG